MEIVEISDKEKQGWDGMGWDSPSQAGRKRRIKGNENTAMENTNDGELQPWMVSNGNG
jgi:hypothetical protein